MTERPSSGPRAGVEAYRRAGVDLEAAARAVRLIGEVAREASRPEVVRGVGGFAGLVSLGDGRLLAAATDGVGTKLEVARRAGRLDTVGIDCVAMCANDVVCTGAEPLAFLDYLAVERLVPEEAAAVVRGVAEGCRRAGCALLGGETAEHPGVLPPGGLDLAGFCVGLVREEALLGPERVREGDLLVAFPSSGLHANGFGLVRRALLDAGRKLDEWVPALGRTLGEELLEPTVIYVRPLLALAGEGLARSAAHVTGGGVLENLPRALPEGLGALLDRSAWAVPPVFGLVAEAAGLAPDDLFGVLNMGLGMVVVVPRGSEDRALAVAAEAGVAARVVGEVVPETGVRLVP
ncbi:MAG TPA: phosphoribosylformylglycinamidine cyclo-ligase [Actinomycetota bacterium]|nr:phosphoribosylformylglycinamidine cyclo-ligase [Actinomycetota bacterium]